MGVERYLLGVMLTFVALGPIALGAQRVRARALPGWTGAPARVAEVIAIAALVVVALEVVGVAGALDLTGAVAACAVIGLLAWRAAGMIPLRSGAIDARPPSPTRASRTETAVAVAAVALLTAAWVARVSSAYRHGMETPDTVWYHLPMAARFVQTGSILHLHYVDANPVTVFYPANAELFHSLGLLLFHSDLVSPVIDLSWAVLALVAGWAIGRRIGRAPHCVIAVVLVLATPALVDTQPGGGYNDVVDIALLLCAVAVLVNGGVGPAPSAFAAASAGLALGTKFTMIVPAVALAAGVVAISARGTRLRQAGIWAAGLVVCGGWWYVRNAVLVGNPLPPIAVHLGPLSLPAPHVGTQTFTVAQYLTNTQVWGAYYLPGLQRALGPAAWGIIVLAAAGALCALFSGRDRLQRMLGAVAVVSGAVFLITPQFLGAPGAPFFFVFNVRYTAVPLVLGLVLLPLQRALDGARRGALLLAGAALILVATEIDPSIWPTGLGLTPFSAPARGGDAIVGAAVGAAVLCLGLAWVPVRHRVAGWPGLKSTPGVALATGALASIIAVSGWFIGDAYARRRYVSTLPLPVIFHWAQNIHHTRIGIVGGFYGQYQYPLYGADDSNYVQYIGATQPHAGFSLISNCRIWRQTVDKGRYEWLVLIPTSPELRWTQSSSAVTLTLRERVRTGELFRVKGHLDPATCPR
jgi:hypothetical protein